MRLGKCPFCKAYLYDSDIDYKAAKLNSRPPGGVIRKSALICKKCDTIIGWA